jgi:Nickel responsive protein SCO4226-like
MPRYLVERVFRKGWDVGDDTEELCRQILERNYDNDVLWLHSYVSDDRKRLFCIYEAPSPEAIRKSAAHNHLPVDSITSIRVLNPYQFKR